MSFCNGTQNLSRPPQKVQAPDQGLSSAWPHFAQAHFAAHRQLKEQARANTLSPRLAVSRCNRPRSAEIKSPSPPRLHHHRPEMRHLMAARSARPAPRHSRGARRDQVFLRLLRSASGVYLDHFTKRLAAAPARSTPCPPREERALLCDRPQAHPSHPAPTTRRAADLDDARPCRTTLAHAKRHFQKEHST
jgi:hypothetical protein